MISNKNSLELEPTILTIFGITGDLARHKLLPSLYYLAKDGLLPKAFKIVGVSRRHITKEQVVDSINEAVNKQGDKCDRDVLNLIEQSISVISMDIIALDQYGLLKRHLDDIETDFGECMNRLFYLAIPAQIFAPIVELLGKSDLSKGCQHGVAESRLLIEKPLGQDINSAFELVKTISNAFNEQQLYLIDHYLAKEGVKTIFEQRFGQSQVHQWVLKDIRRIVIRADETKGVEGRVVFYEQMGALRDVVQSHLLQIMAIATMEQPKDFTSKEVHAAKLKLLKQVETPDQNQVTQISARGQYDDYQQEIANPGSQVETFAAVALYVNTKNLTGVPIILRTGKKLASKRTEVQLEFKDGGSHSVSLDYVSKDGFKDAYELVIAEAMRGDKTLFVSVEEALESWRIMMPILNCWAQNQPTLDLYTSGSDGPESYHKLLEL